MSVVGQDEFLVYLDNFRYPLSGEFAVTATLARSNRMPSDWGLEVGTLAEIFRNTSPKRVCQVDLGRPYEHKHQKASIDNPAKGLMKMAADVLISIFRTLASRGVVFEMGHFVTLRSAYLRMAQDSIRQYHADALLNGLRYDRHAEERFVEALAEQVTVVGEEFLHNPSGGEAMPTWTRVLAALPGLPHELRAAAAEDAREYG
jgi:glucosyl-3-phosphoglycerate synthase